MAGSYPPMRREDGGANAGGHTEPDAMFSYISPAHRVPKDHPLQTPTGRGRRKSFQNESLQDSLEVPSWLCPLHVEISATSEPKTE